MASVEMRGGLLVDAEALALLVGLEARGCTFRVKGEKLVVNPAAVVTAEDKAAIARLRPHLLALVAYEAPA